jgi:hypothetical protein
VTDFLRVRAATGPKHEFHAAAGEVAAHPDLYTVIDKEPASKPEPPTYFVPKKRGGKPVGDTTKENKNA